jgi:DNA-binding NarL/FixJ family response regulator
MDPQASGSGGITFAGGPRLLRETLARVVELETRFEACTLAEDGVAILDRVERTRPAIAALLLPISRIPATELLRRGRERCPQTAFLVVGGGASPSVVADLLRAGARSFVPADAGRDVLLAALDALASGRSYLPREVASDFTRLLRGGPGRTNPELTERQREVLEGIAQGLTTREIAAALGISVKTAESHRSRLMDRVGVHKASSLVRVAIAQGLISG